MSILLHSSAVALYSYTIWYDQQYINLPFPSSELEKMSLKARIIFLTFWCIVLQTVYFTIALLNDVVGTNTIAPKNPPLIRKIKDTLFGLAFTLAIYVAAFFWGLYFIDKEFIYPEYIASTIPTWMNHAMHTLIVPFILLELFMSNRNYPSRTLGISVSLVFCLSYLFLLHYIYFSYGVWVYPFLNVLSVPMKGLFFGSSAIIGGLVYLLGEKLDKVLSPNVRQTYTNGNSKKH